MSIKPQNSPGWRIDKSHSVKQKHSIENDEEQEKEVKSIHQATSKKFERFRSLITPPKKRMSRDDEENVEKAKNEELTPRKKFIAVLNKKKAEATQKKSEKKTPTKEVIHVTLAECDSEDYNDDVTSKKCESKTSKPISNLITKNKSAKKTKGTDIIDLSNKEIHSTLNSEKIKNTAKAEQIQAITATITTTTEQDDEVVIDSDTDPTKKVVNDEYTKNQEKKKKQRRKIRILNDDDTSPTKIDHLKERILLQVQEFKEKVAKEHEKQKYIVDEEKHMVNVFGLAEQTQPEKLRKTFSQFGKIRGVFIHRKNDRIWAQINMYSEGAADDAVKLNDTELDGVKISVRRGADGAKNKRNKTARHEVQKMTKVRRLGKRKDRRIYEEFIDEFRPRKEGEKSLAQRNAEKRERKKQKISEQKAKATL